MKRNPWLGLASYEEHLVMGDNSYKFCGRADATSELFSLVDNNLFVTLYGKSGIGKSSILQAGLFPKMRANRYFPVHIRLGVEEKDNEEKTYAEIIVDILRRLLKSNNCSSSTNDDFSISADTDEYLWSFFATTEFTNEYGQVVFPVIVLDQFEELFFRSTDKLAKLLKQIYMLLDDSTLSSVGNIKYSEVTNFRFIFSIREDDFFRLEDIIERMRLIEMKYNRYRLKEMNDKDAAEVIITPAGTMLPIEQRDAVVTRIIEVVRKESENGEVNTAVLSLLCSRIYDYMQSCCTETISLPLVNKFLASSGGNFLASFYNIIIRELKNKMYWEYIEDNLVTDEGRRSSVPKSAFEANVRDADFLFSGECAILRYVTYSSGREAGVEIIHDLLARHMRESRNERHLRLATARKRSKQIRYIITSMVVILIILFAYHSFTIQEKQNNLLIIQSRYLASESKRLIEDGNVTKAIKLLLHALPIDIDNPNRPWVAGAELQLRTADKKLKHIGGISHLYHDKRVTSASFSPDGKYIVTASWDNTARIWSAKDGAPVGEPMKHDDYVISASFSPDGKYIVTASGDKTARIWPFQPLQELLDKYNKDEGGWKLTEEEKREYYLE